MFAATVQTDFLLLRFVAGQSEAFFFNLTRVKSVKLTSCVVKDSIYFVHQQVFGSGGGIPPLHRCQYIFAAFLQ